MPILSMFYGIIIRMYFYDNKEHHASHLHAEYSGKLSVFSIEDVVYWPAHCRLERLKWCRRGLKSIEKN